MLDNGEGEAFSLFFTILMKDASGIEEEESQ
jgi:hypothetical protein